MLHYWLCFACLLVLRCCDLSCDVVCYVVINSFNCDGMVFSRLAGARPGSFVKVVPAADLDGVTEVCIRPCLSEG
jgi:hypothetical protein